MNKIVDVSKENGKIRISLNSVSITEFNISQNKINGKELFDRLDIKKDDIFSLKPLEIKKESKEIDDIVLTNTYEFLKRVVERINDKLGELKE